MTSPSSSAHLLLRIAVLLAVLATAFPAARANVGPPSTGGQLVAEPVGVVDVAITRETLVIDMRPLAENGFVQVEAVYHLRNDGAEKDLSLVFASGSKIREAFQVWFDARPVACSFAPEMKLPASWEAPKQTPGIEGRNLEFLLYHARDIKPVAFSVRVPSGTHELKVRYDAEAATHHYGEPNVYRQFAYVLAPARAWSSFGGLDLTVHLPEGWRAASEPALDRQGDTLTGKFDDLPADSLALTVQAPEGWAYQPTVIGGIALFALACVGGLVACWWGGRSKGLQLARPITERHGFLHRHAWPTALGLAITWALGVLGCGLLAVFAPGWVLPPGQESQYGYGQAFAVLGLLLLSSLALPAGFLITQVTAMVVKQNENTRALMAHQPPA